MPSRSCWLVQPGELTEADGFVPKRAMMAPPLADPGTAEAITSRILGQGEDGLPDGVLILGIAGPRPDPGRPRPFGVRPR